MIERELNSSSPPISNRVRQTSRASGSIRLLKQTLDNGLLSFRSVLFCFFGFVPATHGLIFHLESRMCGV